MESVVLESTGTERYKRVQIRIKTKFSLDRIYVVEKNTHAVDVIQLVYAVQSSKVNLNTELLKRLNYFNSNADWLSLAKKDLFTAHITGK